MIQIDPKYVAATRTMQEMLLHTHGGELMLAVLMDQGHINEKIGDEKRRIEHDLVRAILQGCGIELVPKQAELVSSAPISPNLIDQELEGERNE